MPFFDTARRGLVGALVAGATLAVPQVAAAYTHSWGCSTGSATRCWDNVGANPNPWELVDAATAEPHAEICAKAVTPANNTRTGSGCNYNTTYRRSDIAGGTPESVAYVYWAGPYGPFSINGWAAT